MASKAHNKCLAFIRKKKNQTHFGKPKHVDFVLFPGNMLERDYLYCGCYTFRREQEDVMGQLGHRETLQSQEDGGGSGQVEETLEIVPKSGRWEEGSFETASSLQEEMSALCAHELSVPGSLIMHIRRVAHHASIWPFPHGAEQVEKTLSVIFPACRITNFCEPEGRSSRVM